MVHKYTFVMHSPKKSNIEQLFFHRKDTIFLPKVQTQEEKVLLYHAWNLILLFVLIICMFQGKKMSKFSVAEQTVVFCRGHRGSNCLSWRFKWIWAISKITTETILKMIINN